MRIQPLKAAFHKVLEYQSTFSSPFTYFRALSMATNTTPAEDPNITRLLTFWFPPNLPLADATARWFRPNSTLDAEIKSLFNPLITSAQTTSLDHWTDAPRGTLALLLLLDQFPRNCFRGSAASFDADAKALDVAVRAIAKGQDRTVEPTQALFFYLPLMHDETILGQVAGIALYEGLVRRCETEEFRLFAESALGYSRSHLQVVQRFGRFPGRNDALGRESTEEEREFLKEHPSGF